MDKFVVVYFFPHEPMQVHGLFDSVEAGMEYAERRGFGDGHGAYAVHEVLNVSEV
jgi:hypothetical protein